MKHAIFLKFIDYLAKDLCKKALRPSEKFSDGLKAF